MSSHAFTASDAARLQAAGYRLTAPRQTIIAGLRDAGRYCTAQQLYERLRGRTVGLASVYRTLELLAELGLAQKRAEDAGEASYLYCSPTHHHHVICTDCGAVREIDASYCPVPEQIAAVEAATGFNVEGHTLDFHGRCADCDARGT